MIDFVTQLEQVTPPVTTPVIVLQPEVIGYAISNIVVTNTSGAQNPKSIRISIYHAQQSTTLDETTALIFNYNIDDGSSFEVNTPFLVGPNDTLAVDCDTADGATFTFYGNLT